MLPQVSIASFGKAISSLPPVRQTSFRTGESDLPRRFTSSIIAAVPPEGIEENDLANRFDESQEIAMIIDPPHFFG